MEWALKGSIQGPQGIQGVVGPPGDPASNLVTSVAGRQGVVVLTKADVGLPLADNTTDLAKPISTAVQTALNGKQNSLGFTPENTANKNQANGYAGLDASSLIPSILLPSYVDDVLEYANLAACPGTGTTGKIYVTLDTNKTYRWSGSAYVEISSSPGSTDQVTEGVTNLYYTQARVDARVQAGLIAERTTPRTVTNTRVTMRCQQVTNVLSWTIDSDSYDCCDNTGITANVTINNPTGTPTSGQRLYLALTASTNKTISWGTAFEASSVALPTATGTTRKDIELLWNAMTSKWRIIRSV